MEKTLPEGVKIGSALQVGEIVGSDILVLEQDRHELVALAVLAER